MGKGPRGVSQIPESFFRELGWTVTSSDDLWELHLDRFDLNDGLRSANGVEIMAPGEAETFDRMVDLFVPAVKKDREAFGNKEGRLFDLALGPNEYRFVWRKKDALSPVGLFATKHCVHDNNRNNPCFEYDRHGRRTRMILSNNHFASDTRFFYPPFSSNDDAVIVVGHSDKWDDKLRIRSRHTLYTIWNTLGWAKGPFERLEINGRPVVSVTYETISPPPGVERLGDHPHIALWTGTVETGGYLYEARFLADGTVGMYQGEPLTSAERQDRRPAVNSRDLFGMVTALVELVRGVEAATDDEAHNALLDALFSTIRR